MTSGTRIDAAEPKDREIILSLVLNQFSEHSIEVDRDELLGAIDVVLATPELGLFLIARHNQQPVGVAYVSFIWALEHCGRSAWLEELYVTPDHRDCGIGRALLARATGRAGEYGCAAIDLEVDQSLARAENLYRREGFECLPRKRWVKTLNAPEP